MDKACILLGNIFLKSDSNSNKETTHVQKNFEFEFLSILPPTSMKFFAARPDLGAEEKTTDCTRYLYALA